MGGRGGGGGGGGGMGVQPGDYHMGGGGGPRHHDVGRHEMEMDPYMQDPVRA